MSQLWKRYREYWYPRIPPAAESGEYYRAALTQKGRADSTGKEGKDQTITLREKPSKRRIGVHAKKLLSLGRGKKPLEKEEIPRRANDTRKSPKDQKRSPSKQLTTDYKETLTPQTRKLSKGAYHS